MLGAKTISVSIARPWREIYERIWRPEQFPSWASGLSNAHLERDGEWWCGRGPEGSIRVRFTGYNDFGVMDHWVDAGGGSIVYVPLRTVENGEGAEVLLTLFRQPGMSDTKFAEDEAWVRRDLEALKRFIEG